jgi:DUF1680 family protein
MKTGKIACFFLLFPLVLTAQEKGLMNTSHSTHIKLKNVAMTDVRWTKGFWAERFEVYKDTLILSMWKTLNDPEISHSFRNFEIAAGEVEGTHSGPPFHDGDFYKWFEAVASVYAVTNDPKLDSLMDRIIHVIGKAQRADGYIHTPVIIEERNQTNKETAFSNRLNFETYNLGHLMTAACVHYRATGKRTLLDIAVKATNFLCRFYGTASAELARNAICPSHYMGVVEMFRTTHNPAYLNLAKNLIDIRGMVENGTEDNQDRIPFREQTTAMGHAVRANYLYAGVADVFAETGEQKLKENLELIQQDIVNRKMYITGGCGALYDGVSPDGTCYDPDSIQKIHQAYGRAYQLPNITAHNETCANIGNLLFNWRMLQLTGDEKYADVVETTLYNSILSGVSLDGKKFFYTNPLRISKDFPYVLRWPKERTSYISCFCCPPNTVRTLCEAHNYCYSVSDSGIWFHLYGGNQLSTTLPNGMNIRLTQASDYPWDGKITVKLDEVSEEKVFSLYFRIPAWCSGAQLTVNGQPMHIPLKSGSYVEINRKWEKGDIILLNLDMETQLIESNPLVEETRNQVAVRRGPLVYCMESVDVESGHAVDAILLPADIKLTPRKIEIENSPIVCLEGKAEVVSDNTSWGNTLYRPMKNEKQTISIRLIPYYAWGNRGKGEMTVWMPVLR